MWLRNHSKSNGENKSNLNSEVVIQSPPKESIHLKKGRVLKMQGTEINSRRCARLPKELPRPSRIILALLVFEYLASF